MARRRPASVTFVLSRQSSAPALSAAVASSVVAWALTMTAANGTVPEPSPSRPSSSRPETSGSWKSRIAQSGRIGAADLDGRRTRVDDGRHVREVLVATEVEDVEIRPGRVIFDDQDAYDVAAHATVPLRRPSRRIGDMIACPARRLHRVSTTGQWRGPAGTADNRRMMTVPRSSRQPVLRAVALLLTLLVVSGSARAAAPPSAGPQAARRQLPPGRQRRPRTVQGHGLGARAGPERRRGGAGYARVPGRAERARGVRADRADG